MAIDLTNFRPGSRMWTLVAAYNERRVALAERPVRYAGIEWTEVDTLAEAGVAPGARVFHVNFWSGMQQWLANQSNGSEATWVDAFPVLGPLGEQAWPEAIGGVQWERRFGDGAFESLDTAVGNVSGGDVLSDLLVEALEERMRAMRYVLRLVRSYGQLPTPVNTGFTLGPFFTCQEARTNARLLWSNRGDGQPAVISGRANIVLTLRAHLEQMQFGARPWFQAQVWSGSIELRAEPWPVAFPVRRAVLVGQALDNFGAEVSDPRGGAADYALPLFGSPDQGSLFDMQAVGTTQGGYVASMPSQDAEPMDLLNVNCGTVVAAGGSLNRGASVRLRGLVVEPEFEHLAE